MNQKRENIVYNILTSNFGTVGYINVRKLVLLNSYLLIGIFAFSLMGSYSLLVAKDYIIATIDIIAAIAFVWCFISLRVYRNKKVIINFVSVLLVVFMVAFAALNGNKSFGLIWSFFAPMFLITMNGYKKGAILSIFTYVSIIIVLLLARHTWEEKDIDILVFTRYVVAYAMASFVVFMGEYAISKLQRELKDISETDSLTKLHNRGKMEEHIEAVFEDKRSTNKNLVIVMADVDDFKAINDTFGHHVGDEVLQDLSKILTRKTRSIDMVGRWGGEEFLMLFPGTSLTNAVAMVERLRDVISSFDFGVNIQVTCSFGICDITTNDFTSKDALIYADKALYRAKNEGKNKICTVAL